MTFENHCSLASNLLQVGALVFLALEMRAKRIQEKVKSLEDVQDKTDHLITLAFSKYELFQILDDEPGANPVLERYYLQLWLNSYLEIHRKLSRGMVESEQSDALIRDMSATFAQKNMQRHWALNRSYYPGSFQKRIDGIIAESKKAEPPLLPAAARED
jgi:hypothetical protein